MSDSNDYHYILIDNAVILPYNIPHALGN